MNGEKKKTERIWLTSVKGGVGVSFAAANLALALSRRGRRVLLVDGAPVCRSLDTVFSCAEDVIYDISDLAAHRVEVEKAVLSPLGEDGPWLLPGVYSGEEAVFGESLAALFAELEEKLSPDFILVDAPATKEAVEAACAYDRILLLTDPSAAALRAAQMGGVMLRERGCTNVFLLINRFSLLPPRESGQEKAISMVDAATVPLLGILPTVGELSETAHRYVGKYPLLGDRAFRAEPARLAFDNLAARLLCEHAPLLSNVRAVRAYRRKLLY